MFGVVLTSSNIFVKESLLMSCSKPPSSVSPFKFPVKNLSGELKRKVLERIILQFLRWSTGLFFYKEYVTMHLKRKVFPFLTTTTDMRVVGTPDVPTVTLASDSKKKMCNLVFLSLKTAPPHTPPPAWFLLQITRCSVHQKITQCPPQ